MQDCLRERLSDLSDGCRASEFKELQVEAQSIDLNPKLKRACAKPLKDQCGDCGAAAAASASGEGSDATAAAAAAAEEVLACTLKCLRGLVESDGGEAISKQCQNQV